jgi:hypothetical protein
MIVVFSFIKNPFAKRSNVYNVLNSLGVIQPQIMTCNLAGCLSILCDAMRQSRAMVDEFRWGQAVISFNNKAFDLINVNYSQFYNFYACRPRLVGNGLGQGLHNSALKRAFRAVFPSRFEICHSLSCIFM